MNELEKRAKRHRKKQKGMSPFINKDAGNVEYNMAMFNKMMGNTPSEQQAETSSETSSEASTGETSANAFVGMGEGMNINETSTSRVLHHLQDDNNFAIVSPYRGEKTLQENKRRMVELKHDVRSLGHGYIHLLSRWVEDGQDFDEESLLVPHMKKDEAIKLGKKYDQSSIIVKDEEGCFEICTTPFETYDEGDVVRVFSLYGDKPMNIKDAEDIFAHRKGGPVSVPIKGGKPFHLSEVYEVIPPRPSYFQNKYRLEKIFECSVKEEQEHTTEEDYDDEFDYDNFLESKGFINTKRALWGDPSGKIKTFAIISPENPYGFFGSDEYKNAQSEYENNPSKYNKEKLNQLKKELTDKARKTGETGLRMGGFNYIPIRGQYKDSEHSLLIFNIPYVDAEGIARDYGQESFFYGEVSTRGSIISYYETSNNCKTYKLIEKSDVVSDETDAEDYFSKFGVKFRINMRQFGDEVKPIYRYDDFNESMNENRTFLSRARCRKRCYVPYETNEDDS